MNIKERLKSPTPKFWKKVVRIGVGIGAVAGAMLLAPITLPALVVTAAGYGVAVGTTALILAKLTKVDVSDIQNMDFSEKLDLKADIEKIEAKRDLTEHEQNLKDELNRNILS